MLSPLNLMTLARTDSALSSKTSNLKNIPLKATLPPFATSSPAPALPIPPPKTGALQNVANLGLPDIRH